MPPDSKAPAADRTLSFLLGGMGRERGPSVGPAGPVPPPPPRPGHYVPASGNPRLSVYNFANDRWERLSNQG